MEFVKLALSSYGSYSYENASSIEMDILGLFLTSNVGYYPSSFREWVMNDDWGDETNSNTIALKKDKNYILLNDIYSEEENPTELKMTLSQFLQLLDDWEEKVIKKKPKEVIIKYDNDQFAIETKD